MIGQIIGSLGGLATSYIDGKTAVKKAEAETKMKDRYRGNILGAGCNRGQS